MAKTRSLFKFIIIPLFVLIIGSLGYIYYIYSITTFPINKATSCYLYIPSGSNYEDVKAILKQNKLINNERIFEWMVEKKNYKQNVHSGKYKVYCKTTNNKLKELLRINALINALRSGEQEPILITFNSIRKKEEFAGKVSQYLELDSVSLINALNNPEIYGKYGFNKETFLTMFLPDSYEFYWDTDVESFIKRMAEEYKKFWNDSRKTKAKIVNLSQSEVSILASIVQKESLQEDEKPTIAGVYINRLKRNQKLEADPTVVFAVGDFTITRVLKRHLKIDSPYNTYKYIGLPPGPICLPSKASIDAVLNYKKHNYLFFCAKGDGSGYHNFAKTYNEHLKNARIYRKNAYGR